MVIRWFPVAAICFAALLGACASVDYVPDTGWADDNWSANFYEEWFGKQLAAAGEPTLATQADLGELSSRFRLLVLPSFSPASVYRIDEDSSGKFRLTFIVLSGTGGYKPGRVAERWTRELTKDENFQVSSAIEQAQLKSVELDPELSSTVDEDGNELIVCTDGTRIVVERLTKTERSFVTRHECELHSNPKLKRLYDVVSSLRLAA